MKTPTTHRLMRLCITVIAAAATLAACGGGSSDDSSTPPVNSGPVAKSGYITLPDGNKMRYSLVLPNDQERFPLLVVYDGYAAGSVVGIAPAWVNEGYAVMGINVPGTGCSSGDNQVFDASTGAAGAFAIEWAAEQDWSTGRVGMLGSSYSGYNQLWVAAHQPKGLVAITPSKNVADPYRDVGYPGGIPNIGFPNMWWGLFPMFWNQAAAIVAPDDKDCAATAARNIANLDRPDLDLRKWLENPYADGLYVTRSANRVTHAITIPTLGNQSWQDEQISTRAGYYEDTIDPKNMWLVSSNGTHNTNSGSPEVDQTIKRFLAHFVKGENNGFENEPRVRIFQEMQTTDERLPNGAGKLQSRAMADLGSMPVQVTPMRLWLQAGGGLSDSQPAAQSSADSASSYEYPVGSPTVNVPPPLLGGAAPAGEGWEATTVAGKSGELSFTTAPLAEPLSFYGEGSADIWLSATAPNTDLQVTLSEVRPDGQEMFVQRGWLRASKRKLDASRSSTIRAYHSFLAQDEQPLSPNTPQLARMEINKFAHVFRAGSSIRVTFDTPSNTGYWIFGNDKTPSTNTIWHDSTAPSSIVLGYLPYAHAESLPSCDTTLRQPCRKNDNVVPTGIGPKPPMALAAQ